MSETRVPLYRYPASYAREHGELEQYRASHQANCACRDMIEKEARENYQDNVLNTNAVLDTAVSEFGYERVLHVLAATLRSKDWDDRFSRENKAWAKSVGTPMDVNAAGDNRSIDYAINQCHSCLTDLLVTAARRYLPRGCYTLLRSTKEIVIIKRGETGYYQTGIHAKSKAEGMEIVDEYNQKLGLSKAQAAAMEAGSMFGWNVPAADPRSYDQNGKLLRAERGEHER